MKKVYSVTDARKILGELLNRVKFGKEEIILGRHGNPEAKMIRLSQEEVDAIISGTRE